MTSRRNQSKTGMSYVNIQIKGNTILIFALVVLAVFVCMLLSACEFDPQSILPPGALGGTPQNAIRTNAEPFSSEKGTGIPPEIVATQTPHFSFITGDWRCHPQPNEASDTVIFLHDGELVGIIGEPEESPNWVYIQAGRHQCYVNREAIE